MKVYFTKYALSTGIEIIDGKEDTQFGKGYFKRTSGYIRLVVPKDWAKTRDEAIKQAEEKRQKMIKSLKKKIAKLEAMEFDPPEIQE